MLRRIVTVFLVLVIAACSSNKFKEENPNTPGEVNARLGLAYMQQGNLDIALEKLKRALRYDSKLPKTHHYIAEVYSRLGAAEDAQRHYKRAVELDPEDLALQNNYGIFLCDQGQYEEAAQLFLAIARKPLYKKQDQAYENAGVCVMRIPDYEKAESHFRAALKINQGMLVALFQMSTLHFETRKYLKARAFLQRYLSLSQQNPQSLWLGIRIERQLGDFDTVAEYASLLRRLYPRAEETRRLRATEN